MHRDLKPVSGAEDLRLGLAVSRYHGDVTAALRDGAIEMFHHAGGRDDHLTVIEVPGSFELTAACRALAARGDVDAVVALGCIVTGETTHDRHLADAVAGGLTSITVHTGVPVSFGVLTCQSIDQARERAGGAKGNKGAEAMAAAIDTVLALRAATRREKVT